MAARTQTRTTVLKNYHVRTVGAAKRDPTCKSGAPSEDRIRLCPRIVGSRTQHNSVLYPESYVEWLPVWFEPQTPKLQTPCIP